MAKLDRSGGIGTDDGRAVAIVGAGDGAVSPWAAAEADSELKKTVLAIEGLIE